MYFNYKKDIEYTKIVLGLDSSKFSDYIGISRMTINRWIKGDIIPSYDSLEKLYSKIYDSNIHLIELKEE